MYYGPDVFDIDQPLNTQWKFNHEEGCKYYGEGPDYRERLYVKRTDKGWVYYCHNCGAAGLKEYNSQQLLKTLLDQPRERVTIEYDLEEKYELSTAPLSGDTLSWLYKYDIKDSEIAIY